MRAAAEAAKAELEIRRLAVPMGGAVFHHQDQSDGSDGSDINLFVHRPIQPARQTLMAQSCFTPAVRLHAGWWQIRSNRAQFPWP